MKKRDLRVVLFCYNNGGSKIRKYIKSTYDKNLLNCHWRSITTPNHAIEFFIPDSKKRFLIKSNLDYNSMETRNLLKSFVIKALNYFVEPVDYTYNIEIAVTKDTLDDSHITFLGNAIKDDETYNVYNIGYHPRTDGEGVFKRLEMAEHYVKRFWYLELPEGFSKI